MPGDDHSFTTTGQLHGEAKYIAPLLGDIAAQASRYCGTSARRLQNQASRDHSPAPTLIRKSKLIVIAKSVLASLTMNQKPWSGRTNSGILVVAIAVRMTIKSGMLAILVNSPIRTSKPQATSKLPTKCAVKSGDGNPILAKRRTPM